MFIKKIIVVVLTVLAISGSAPLRANTVLQPNDIVAICGDSITQQKLYSVYIEDYLMMCQPIPNIQAVQFGKNGAGAYVLNKDIAGLIPFHPTVATMLFGMNDGQYQPLNEERANGYRKGTADSIQGLKRIGVRVVLVGSPDAVYGADMYNVTLASLGDIARDEATKAGVLYVDNHALMDGVLKKIAPNLPADLGKLYFDVHPEPVGHMMMTYSFLKGLGCEGAIGTITVDLAQNQATGTPGQKILAVHDGSVDVESTRYPFCFHGDPAKLSSDTASILKYLPFNQELNRYTLIVHGLTTAQAKVTWGTRSVVLNAGELLKGVNLADLFVPNNPFSAAFDKVDRAVCQKQAVETTLTWEYLADIGRLKQAIPAQSALLDDIATGGYEEVARLNKAAAATIVPVRHTIKIEPLP